MSEKDEAGVLVPFRALRPEKETPQILPLPKSAGALWTKLLHHQGRVGQLEHRFQLFTDESSSKFAKYDEVLEVLLNATVAYRREESVSLGTVRPHLEVPLGSYAQNLMSGIRKAIWQWVRSLHARDSAVAVHAHYVNAKRNLQSIRDDGFFGRLADPFRHSVTLLHDVLTWTPYDAINEGMAKVVAEQIDRLAEMPVGEEVRRDVYQSVRKAGFHLAPIPAKAPPTAIRGNNRARRKTLRPS